MSAPMKRQDGHPVPAGARTVTPGEQNPPIGGSKLSAPVRANLADLHPEPRRKILDQQRRK
jgi:hypothetical protein